MKIDITTLRSQGSGQTCKKVGTTLAKELSFLDYFTSIGLVKFNWLPFRIISFGVMQTLEGPSYFKPGYFKCKGAKGEIWPMNRKGFLEAKRMIKSPDLEGWSTYENINTVTAYKIDHDFEVTLVSGAVITGMAGSYVIDNGTDQWIIAADIFEKTYQLL